MDYASDPGLGTNSWPYVELLQVQPDLEELDVNMEDNEDEIVPILK